MYSSALLILAAAFSALPATLAQSGRNSGLSLDASVNVDSNGVSVNVSATLPTDSDGIIAGAVTVDNGDYILTNVGSGVNLTYSRGSRGQELFPDDGAGSALTLQTMGDAYTVIKPRDANNKCMSAQWDYDLGRDWAGALYACKVMNFSKRHATARLNTRQVTLRLAKQYWYLIPGTTENAYKIIPVDHLLDMPPLAIDDGQRIATSNGQSRYPALNLLDNTDLTQEWYITPASASA